ncbi:methyl-accepting chemotaxis protein [Paremcibacter congregatus]|uniref:methyl-accepting chemotaxis protein n=1 Tax=Paremcibacter congregatus TaxID=2043170 RepID=UPI0030EBB2C0|tara:strand:- start:4320 stop:6560 length:2241 start_codon:yes stop_codon:yes gene_type:complete
MMNFFNNLNISLKLPAFIVTFLVIACSAVGISAYFDAKATVHSEAENKLTAVLSSRKSELEGYIRSIEEDLKVTAMNPSTAKAITTFQAAWTELGDNPTSQLQRLYITDNPESLGEKDNYNDAGDGSPYSAAHAQYHPWFHQLQKVRDYYDVFLFNTQGDLIYSVFKENDYATNMNNGEWRDTDLANVFHAAMSSSGEGDISFFDFRTYAPSYGAPASFMATPVMDEQGYKVGVLAFQMPIGRINSIMQKKDGMGESGESYIVGHDNLMRSDSRFAKESTILKTKIEGATTLAALRGETGLEVIEDYRGVQVVSAYTAMNIHGTKWAIIAEIDEAEVNASSYSMRNGMLLIGLVIMTLLSGVALFFTRTLVKPITEMVDTMNILAAGNNDIDIPHTEREDEIGAMAESVEGFKQSALERIRLEEETRKAEQAQLQREEEERQAAAAREQEEIERERAALEAREARARKIEQLIKNFENKVTEMLEVLAASSTEMSATANQMVMTSDDTKTRSAAVSSASDESTNNVNMVASAAEELSSSVQEISRQVHKANEISREALEEVGASENAISALALAAEEINKVIGLISDIAEQTNLLALNATIESARAGDAGKGFAVVANEVKALAGQTSSATEEISSQITEMQNLTRTAVNSIKTIVEVNNRSSETTASILAAIEQQSSATNEISQNIQRVAVGTQEVSGNIARVAEGADETGAAGSQVLMVAEELGKISETLKLDVENFLADVRAV